jgi:hypothetical protein
LACIPAAPDQGALYLMPSGTEIAIPAGFNAWLWSDEPLWLTTAAYDKAYNLVSGQTLHFGPECLWLEAHDTFVSCHLGDRQLVFDATGKPTPYSTVTTMHSHGETYYWVTSGFYQGYVSADGTWLYRESCFQLLDD